MPKPSSTELILKSLQFLVKCEKAHQISRCLVPGTGTRRGYSGEIDGMRDHDWALARSIEADFLSEELTDALKEIESEKG